MPECRICGNGENNTLHHVKEMMFGTGRSYDYFACSACQCLQILDPPANLTELYPPDYYSYKPMDEKQFSGIKWLIRRLKIRAALAVENSLSRTAINALFGKTDNHQLFRNLHFDENTRYLDVGAGNGKFLFPLYLSGYPHCLGIDPFIDTDIRYPSGLEIQKKTVFDISGPLDIIFYNHSFEHILEQQQELRQVHKVLVPNGKCVISVPVFPSLAWDRYGTNWYQIDAPRHFYIHSVKSMRQLAESTGFTLERTYFNSTYAQFSISEMYQKGITMKDRDQGKGNFLARKYQKFRHTRLANQQNALGRGDQASFLLAKQT